MSYARTSKTSNIYFYGHDPDNEGFECASCCLNGGDSALIYGAENAIRHIDDHIKAGNKIQIATILHLVYDWFSAERLGEFLGQLREEESY